ncbi:major facilitator superfamily domain-containing protein [Syncephalastrum racemosum]|uniref:Major facilitator superfamily domain-containing protein n=1 Tax=Syncephalastrum racemosum TaxID=13706 RepID=A0A1X2HMB2_SYNRA|nr:major facilitator superfamily domain-containing protein [Syncephalastrum racemosum]
MKESQHGAPSPKVITIHLDESHLSSQIEHQSTCYPAGDNGSKRAVTLSSWLWRLWEGPTHTSQTGFSQRQKTLILFIVALGASISPMDTTLYYPALADVQTAFNTDATATNASNAAFTFVTGVFPMIWATCSEKWGRRPIYLISFAISITGNAICSVSTSISMLIALRFLSAIGSCSVFSLGAGTIGDVFEADERARAMSWYTIGTIVGAAIGPVLGGYLTEAYGWRSVFWLAASLTFLSWCTILLLLPETSPARSELDHGKVTEDDIMHEASARHQRSRHWRFWLLAPLKPFRAMTLLLYPNIFFACLINGFPFGVSLMLLTTFSWTYTSVYHYSNSMIGLCCLITAVGTFLAVQICGRWSDLAYRKERKRVIADGGEEKPEMRLNYRIYGLGLFLNVSSLVAYGWSVQNQVHSAIPIVLSFFVFFGFISYPIIVTTYMIDFNRNRAASSMACNNLLRYIIAGLGTLFSAQLVDALGNGILYTGCAIITLIIASSLIYVKVNSKKWAKLLAQRGS